MTGKEIPSQLSDRQRRQERRRGRKGRTRRRGRGKGSTDPSVERRTRAGGSTASDGKQKSGKVEGATPSYTLRHTQRTQRVTQRQGETHTHSDSQGNTVTHTGLHSDTQPHNRGTQKHKMHSNLKAHTKTHHFQGQRGTHSRIISPGITKGSRQWNDKMKWE